MREAVRLAVESVAEGGGPFGCVIEKDGAIVGAGTNRVTRDNDPTAHAEVVAIRQACERLESFQLDGCTLYCSCEPCPMCLGAIYWARPDRVYYAASREDAAAGGFDDLFIHDEIAADPDRRRILMTQIAFASAGDPFDAWRRAEDKIRY